MGFFKDVNKLKQQAKEIDKTWDPGAQARSGIERMKEMNAQMAATTAAMNAPPGDGVEARAQVVSVGNTMGALNMDPIIAVELLIQQDGLPPRPMSAQIVVPASQLARLTQGATLPVKLSKSDPNALAVEWAAPA